MFYNELQQNHIVAALLESFPYVNKIIYLVVFSKESKENFKVK